MNEARFTDADILACLRDSERIEGRGYQGSIYTGCVGDQKILVKSATGTGIRMWLNRWMLRREHDIYRRLAGISGIPRCYGLFLGHHLALEYLDARTIRQASISDRDSFFVEMLAIIESIHERGVAHGDLKRKDNILVTRDSRPYLVDFGVSVFRKPGFHPLNRFRHGFSHQHDYNAWLKHKYNRNYDDMSPEDARYFRSLWIERASRRIKRAWNKIAHRKKNPR